MTGPRVLIYDEETEARFWSKVDKGADCWEWQAARQKYGHGLFWHRKHLKAHRVSYELANGPIPHGLCVLHQCDNPPCVNPDHLHLGTKADNNRERDERGRHVAFHGEGHPRAILTREQVEHIRSIPKNTKGFAAELALRYGVSKNYIYQVRLGRVWR